MMSESLRKILVAGAAVAALSVAAHRRAEEQTIAPPRPLKPG